MWRQRQASAKNRRGSPARRLKRLPNGGVAQYIGGIKTEAGYRFEVQQPPDSVAVKRAARGGAKLFAKYLGIFPPLMFSCGRGFSGVFAGISAARAVPLPNETGFAR